MDQDAKEILEQIGLSNFEEGLLDGEPPVPVDKEKLRAYWEKSLSPREEAIIGHLLSNYKAWDDALDEIMLEDAADTSVRERLTAALWIQLLMRKRAVMIVSATTLMLLIGLFLWRGGNGGGFRDGDNLVAFRDGRVTGLEQYGPEWSTRASQAHSGDLGGLEGLKQIKGAIRGVRAEDFKKAPMVIAPYGTVVRHRQPTLSWQMVEGVEQYQIEIRRFGERKVIVGPDDVVGQGEWQVPVELDPDALYQWRVSFTDDGETFAAPTGDEIPALFSVLNDERLRGLTRMEQELQGSPLLLFLLYLDYGLLEEARGQLTLLDEANPDSEFVKRLRSGWNEAN